MRTMQPSVTIGSYTWAQDRLPADEFELRLGELRAAMERNSWPAPFWFTAMCAITVHWPI